MAQINVYVLDSGHHILHDKSYTYIHLSVRQLFEDYRKIFIDQWESVSNINQYKLKE